MKKLLIILLCLPMIGFGQSVPQGINYQAVARDANGDVLINQTLTIQFSIISDITTSTVSWVELHGVTTNNYGLFTAIIGEGAPYLIGSSITFDEIDWGGSNHFLKVEIDYGNGFVDMGTTSFMSVPYALHSTPQFLTISGDTLFISSGNYIILPQPILVGCTDSTAINYNSLANTDNGSCIPVILGCTDSSQFNYNPLANTNDGTCIPKVYGCMDTLACNYDTSVNIDDGACLLPDGCTDTAAFNYDPTATCDNGSCASQIGDYYQGGIIFYLDGNGGGLICATEDQTYPTGTYFGCWGTSVTGTSLSLGTGAANTAALISQGCGYTGNPARLCSDYTGGGYTDWYLPSYNELIKMFQQRSLIAANPAASPFATWVSGGAVHYWSSSASSACSGGYCDIYAHAMRWSSNYYLYSSTSNRNTNHSVRAIRSF